MKDTLRVTLEMFNFIYVDDYNYAYVYIDNLEDYKMLINYLNMYNYSYHPSFEKCDKSNDDEDFSNLIIHY